MESFVLVFTIWYIIPVILALIITKLRNIQYKNKGDRYRIDFYAPFVPVANLGLIFLESIYLVLNFPLKNPFTKFILFQKIKNFIEHRE